MTGATLVMVLFIITCIGLTVAAIGVALVATITEYVKERMQDKK